MSENRKRSFDSSSPQDVQLLSRDKRPRYEDGEEVLRYHSIRVREMSEGIPYRINLEIRRNINFDVVKSIYMDLFFRTEKVGHLEGCIVPRGRGRDQHYNFHYIGDAISGELEELTKLFCNKHGVITHEAVNMEGEDEWNGGFFHIHEIEINKSHRGQDLGLRMIHEALFHLRSDWNLVVLKTNPLATKSRDRYSKKEIKEAQMKISKHWARMGFKQTGKNVDEYSIWHMVSSTYFGSENQEPSSEIMEKWKTKQDVESLDIYHAPEEHIPQGYDKQLKNLIETYFLNSSSIHEANVIQEVERLVHGAGASIHKSRALFILVANVNRDNEHKFAALLNTLVQLGGNIDEPDEFGNCPIHCAASMMKPVALKWLIELGASHICVNEKECTPLKCLEEAIKCANAFYGTYDIVKVHCKDVIERFESIKALTPTNLHQHLIDGWLSPRMMEMLKTTAGVGCKSMEVSSMKNNGPTPLKECCGLFGGIPFIEYIPTCVLKQINPKGLYKSFFDGWKIVWEAMLKVLHNEQIPTITKVREHIDFLCSIGGGRNKINYFLNKGGKIEYALDALLCVTQNVHVTGDDYWVYEEYNDEIEVHLTTPLDSAYDMARVICLEINEDNFKAQPTGPYRNYGEWS